MKNFSKFLKITKTDDEKQMVFGFASTPDMDSQGEIVKVSALKKALPEYLKFPTIREMHQPSAVGKTIESKITEKGLFIGAKIVDKEAWAKVKEGVYKAFSIGGRIVSKVGDSISDIELTEISLVDRPANAQAVITVFKSDVTIESILEKISDDEISSTFMANDVLSITQSLIFMFDSLTFNGKKTKKIEKAIKLLREIAKEMLTGEDKKKFDTDMDVLKNRLASEEEDKEVTMSKLNSVDFAIPGERRMPLTTKKQVAASMLEFLTNKFEDANEEKAIKHRIVKAANERGMSVEGFLEIAAMPMNMRKQKALLSGTGYSLVDKELVERVKKVLEEVSMKKAKDSKEIEKKKKVDPKVEEKPKAKVEAKEEVKEVKPEVKEEKPAEEVKEEKEVKEEVKEEAPADAPKVEVDPAKQVADMPDFMKRLEKLEKSAEEEPKEEVKEETSMTKIVEEGFTKVVNTMEKLDERVKTLEAQPAAPKTKAVGYLEKVFGKQDSTTVVDPAKEAKLVKVNARLAELEEIREQSPGKYVSKHQKEAMNLLDEKAALIR